MKDHHRPCLTTDPSVVSWRVVMPHRVSYTIPPPTHMRSPTFCTLFTCVQLHTPRTPPVLILMRSSHAG